MTIEARVCVNLNFAGLSVVLSAQETIPVYVSQEDAFF